MLSISISSLPDSLPLNIILLVTSFSGAIYQRIKNFEKEPTIFVVRVILAYFISHYVYFSLYGESITIASPFSISNLSVFAIYSFIFDTVDIVLYIIYGIICYSLSLIFLAMKFYDAAIFMVTTSEERIKIYNSQLYKSQMEENNE